MLQTLIELLQLGNRICVSAVPDSPHKQLYASLLCGIDLPSGHEQALFMDTGLIHILVVSGAHLAFLERLFFWLPGPARVSLLAVYCWLTGFGPPVMRALIRRLINPVTAARGWTSAQTEAAAVTLILLCRPAWLFSRSFLMSWACGLALASPPNRFRPGSVWLSAKCYAFLFPFAPSSPLTIAWNCAIGPLIGEILFPAGLAAMICSPLVPLVDWIWYLLLQILAAGPRLGGPVIWLPTSWIWCLVPLLHAALILGEHRWRRGSAFS